MGTVMILSNQTLGAQTLTTTVQDRIDRGVRDFYVVVPAPHTTHEVPGWLGGFEGMAAKSLAEAVVRHTGGQHWPEIEAHVRAEHRLSRMIAQIEAAGGRAQGEVGDEDPLAAAKDALRRRTVDEIIISPLPHARSRWLRMDLPRRLARAHGGRHNDRGPTRLTGVKQPPTRPHEGPPSDSAAYTPTAVP